MITHPLAGKRIVITRPPDQAADFAQQLALLGAEPILLPTITIQPPADTQPIEQAVRHLARYDWVVFTSANAVKAVCRQLTAPVQWPPIAVIGPATAKALDECGLTAALMPDRHIAEDLFEALSSRVDLRGKRILLPQARRARPVLAQLLGDAGALVDVVVAYETVRPDLDPGLLVQQFDAITFTSSSTVQHFVDLFDDPLAVIGEALVVCIGPITADTARGLGLPVHAVADRHTVEGLIAALSERLSSGLTP